MEHVGFYVDKGSIEAYGRELEQQAQALHDSIIEQVGYSFNINSPKQLGEALFDKLGLPHGKKTKSGWSTNADVLEELRYLQSSGGPVGAAVPHGGKLTVHLLRRPGRVIGPDGRIHSAI
ncbi:MAG: DNA polymerase [Oscillospiraceae bacterium]